MEEENRSFKKSTFVSNINSLDDGCLMHIFSFLLPIPDRYNAALVCQRWCFLACHPCQWLRVEQSLKSLNEPGVFPDIESTVSAARPGDTILIAAGADHLACNIQIKKPLCLRWCFLACHPRQWLRVEQSLKRLNEPGVFPDIESAVSAARPGDTILIAPGADHLACNIQIKKPLCLIGGGEHPDDTVLICSRGSDSAFEFLATCKVANLTVKAELGCCLLHRSGKLIIEGCFLQCEENPLDHLSWAIVSTASNSGPSMAMVKGRGDSVSVSHTRIEGGAKAVLTSGTLALQRVRVIYARTALFFWFDVDHL